MNSATDSASRPARRSGFTLNELLVVMGLIILIMALALPAFNLISGARSIESAENRISSYLGVVRGEAIALGVPRGVIMFEDQNTRQVTLAQVFFPPGQNVTAGSALQLEMFGGRDEMVLPKGVGLQGIPDAPPAVTVSRWQSWAVIMFDGDGRVMLDNYKIDSGTNLFTRMPKSGPNVVPVTASKAANIGFIMFDGPAYDAVPAASQGKFLQDNSIPYLVNRYNGSLLKAE